MAKNSDIFLDNNAFFLCLAFLVPSLLALAAANHFWDWQLGIKSLFLVIPIAIVCIVLAERIAISHNPTGEEHDSEF